jgi:hypothetical protein
VPGFSVMNSRPVPSSGAAIAVGRSRPEATWVEVAASSSSGTAAVLGGSAASSVAQP